MTTQPPPIADRLSGIIPPVITPLTERGHFDRASAERLYRFHLDAGVDGLFLFGTSGEGPLLSDIDRTEAVQTAAEVIGGRVPLLVGAIAPGTGQVIAQGRRARELGADALVVCAPFYLPVTQEEVIAHFRAVREAVDLPIVVYDIPFTTNIKIQLETMLTLAREGTVAGVKDSSGDAVGFRRLLSKRPAGFRVFTGAELLIDAALLQGADGSVPGLANVAPELFVQLYRQWREGKIEEATATQERIVRLFDVFMPPCGPFRPSWFLAAMKTAMTLRGVIAGNRTLEPFTPFTPEDEERIRAIMVEVGVL